MNFRLSSCVIALLATLSLDLAAGAVNQVGQAPPAEAHSRQAAQGNDKIEELFRRGLLFDSQSRYPKAVSEFSKAIAQSPDNARAYYLRGLAYFDNAKYQNALDDLNKAIELNANYQDAHLVRALALEDTKDYDKAITDIDWVLTRDPQFKEALSEKADILEKLKRYDLAKSARDKASKMHYRTNLAEGVPATPDFSKFMSEFSAMLQARWLPPRARVSRGAMLYFKPHRDHTISDIKVKRSSGNHKFDEAAEETLRKQRTVPPFPPGAPECVDIDFSFDYNVRHKNGRSYAGLPDSAPPEIEDYSEASQLCTEQKYEEAVPYYLKALNGFNNRHQSKRDSERVTDMRSALGVCYYHAAEKFRQEPKEQIKYLQQALYYRPDLEDAQKALTDAISQIGKDPKSADDRIQLGDEALAAGDDIGATVEYLEALKIKDDPATRQKLASIKKAHLAKSH